MRHRTPPASIAELHERLSAACPDLPPRLRQCAEHVARHPDGIPVSTAAQVAAAAGVPPATLVRFCQVMGFDGFSQMQRLFRAAHPGQRPDYATRLDMLRRSGAQMPGALLAQFVEAGRDSLAGLIDAVRPEDLEAATAALAAARMIHVAGHRRVFGVAHYLAYVFEQMGVPAMLHAGPGGLEAGTALQPGDALIAISHAPYTDDTVALAARACARGLPVIALTDAATSPLVPHSRAVLRAAEFDVGDFRPLAASVTLAIALATAVGTRRRSDADFFGCSRGEME